MRELIFFFCIFPKKNCSLLVFVTEASHIFSADATTTAHLDVQGVRRVALSSWGHYGSMPVKIRGGKERHDHRYICKIEGRRVLPRANHALDCRPDQEAHESRRVCVVRVHAVIHTRTQGQVCETFPTG